MAQEGLNISREIPRNRWTAGLFVVCIGIILFGLNYSENTEASVPFLIGYNLPLAILFAAVFHMVLGQRKDPRGALTAFVAIYMALMLSSYLAARKNIGSDVKILASEISKKHSTLKGPLYDEDGKPQRIKPIDTTPKTEGDIGTFEKLIKVYLNKIIEQRNGYMLELDAIGVDYLLDPSRLANDRSLLEARVMLRQAHNILDKYIQKTNELMASTRKDLEQLNVDPDMRRRLVIAWDKGMERARPMYTKIWQLEYQAFEEAVKIVDLLEARKDAWYIQNNTIIFIDPSDLQAYNQHLNNMVTISKEQEAEQTRNFESIQRELNSLAR